MITFLSLAPPFLLQRDAGGWVVRGSLHQLQQPSLSAAGRTTAVAQCLRPSVCDGLARTMVPASRAATRGVPDRSALTEVSEMAFRPDADGSPPARACDPLAARWCTERGSRLGTQS